jgi:diguanylate cyclase (GGDEF)-like protein/PAS domain S-box-containing protein
MGGTMHRDGINQDNLIDEKLLRLIFKSIPTSVFFMDTECRYRLVTDVCDHMNRLVTGSSAIGKTDSEFHRENKMSRFYYEDNLQIMRTKKGTHYVTEAYFNEDKYYYDIVKEPVVDPEGNILGIVGLVHDITELKNLEQKLRIMSITDSLTGIYNRTYFNERMQEILTEENLPLSLLIGDCNGLKYVNDTYGHAHGDEFLIEAARILQSAVGSEGEVFRVGGDEFVVLCPRTDSARCAALLDTIRRMEKENTASDIPIYTSFGYSTLTALTDSIKDKLASAEHMMYLEKQEYRRLYPEYYRYREDVQSAGISEDKERRARQDARIHK